MAKRQLETRLNSDFGEIHMHDTKIKRRRKPCTNYSKLIQAIWLSVGTRQLIITPSVLTRIRSSHYDDNVRIKSLKFLLENTNPRFGWSSVFASSLVAQALCDAQATTKAVCK